ncbi:DUF6417 family protein [Streptomyces sp. LE64]|uniref:DUF6417 family protein n=1 Tax=Streptomyces sp. LE64 TaxID=3448653 RepID=UPI004042B393
MRGAEKRLTVLEALHEREPGTRQGWVVDGDLPAGFRKSAESVARDGLVEWADGATRSLLSARGGRPVAWAVRITALGRDVRRYAGAAAPGQAGPGRGERLVKLRPAQMEALRVAVGVADELARKPAPGFLERVRTADFDPVANRWCMYLTLRHIDSVAYVFYLRGLCGSASEANHFARDYGVIYRIESESGVPTLMSVPGLRPVRAVRAR